MLPIRVFFEKKGCAAYISHLDVQRAVIRALQRTGCDFAFTEGFNPHMKLVFAMPLSLFQESTYEIFDVTLLDDNETYPEVLEKLQSVFPAEIMPYAVAAPVKKLACLRAATYEIRIKTDRKAAEISLPSTAMKVLKKAKNGATETDIRPLIRSFCASDTENGILLRVTADCGSQSHLNVAYICEWFGFDQADCDILRTGLLDEEGNLLK